MNGKALSYGRSVLNGGRRGLLPAVVRATAALAEPAYVAAVRGRNLAYDRGWAKSVSLDLPTISVGNLTTGGTGKTPVVGRLVQMLHAMGRHPAVLMRGYAGGAGGSDEAKVLAVEAAAAGIRGLPVVAMPDRVKGAAIARQREPAVDCFVLDDGFQHRRVRRDLDVVLLNATDPFGGGHVLPRGLLREPMAGLSRADVVLLTHASQAGEAVLAKIDSTVKDLAAMKTDCPLLRCSHGITGFQDATGALIPAAEARGRSVLAFCGIGDPASFAQELEAMGLSVALETFPDHHPYQPDDARRLAQLAHRLGVEALVTTEKDWVKVGPLVRNLEPRIGVWRACLELQFEGEHESRLRALVRRAVGGSPRSA